MAKEAGVCPDDVNTCASVNTSASEKSSHYQSREPNHRVVTSQRKQQSAREGIWTSKDERKLQIAARADDPIGENVCMQSKSRHRK